MPNQQKKKTSKRPDSRPARTRYKAGRRREENKLRRILRSNGEAEARAWAIGHKAESILRQFLKERQREAVAV